MKKQSSKWGAVCSLALAFQLVVPPVATVASEVEENVVPTHSEAAEPAADRLEEEQHVDEHVDDVPPAVDSTPVLPEREEGVDSESVHSPIILPEEETVLDEADVERDVHEASDLTDDSLGEKEVVIENAVFDQAAADAAVWGMDGRVVKAYETGEVEYEFAFRHAPQEGFDAVDLEEATFYLDLPAGVQYEGATFGGRYDAANHRVIWVNPGGIPTSHANFDPSTPRRVNVQLKYTNTDHLVKVKAYASYTPKGSTQRFTNAFQLEHGFEGIRPQLSEGVTIKGSLAERPGLPSTFPVLAGERFTYDVEYSLYSPKTPFTNAQLFVQLTDKMKFDKHVQLTGDFSTYRYDAANHRFIFDFKPEIHEANGIMKINNLYFPNYRTASGTDSVIQMTLHYGDSKVVGIEPDTLTAFAVADWQVSKRKVAPSQAPRVGEEVTYEIVASDTNPREYGMLSIDQAELVEKLPKEAKFVNAYELSPDGIETSATYDPVNHQVIFHPTIADGDKEKTFRIVVQYEEVPEQGSVFLSSHYLYKPFEADVEERSARLVHQVVAADSEKETPGEEGKEPAVSDVGSIEVTMTDAKDESKRLSGAVIDLFDETGTVVKRVTTDETGVAKWDELAEGTYTLKVTQAASGYRLDRTVYELDVVAGDVSTLTLQQRKRSSGGGGGTSGVTEEPELPVKPAEPGDGEGANLVDPEEPSDGEEIPSDEGTQKPAVPGEGESIGGAPSQPSTPPKVDGAVNNSPTSDNGSNGGATPQGGVEQGKTKPSTNGKEQLPQTGETSLVISLWSGLALLGAGWLLFRRSARKVSNER